MHFNIKENRFILFRVKIFIQKNMHVISQQGYGMAKGSFPYQCWWIGHHPSPSMLSGWIHVAERVLCSSKLACLGWDPRFWSFAVTSPKTSWRACSVLTHSINQFWIVSEEPWARRVLHELNDGIICLESSALPGSDLGWQVSSG